MCDDVPMSSHKPTRVQPDDEARPLRYVPSMGKRLKATSSWTPDMQRTALKALAAWNRP